MGIRCGGECWMGCVGWCLGIVLVMGGLGGGGMCWGGDFGFFWVCVFLGGWGGGEVREFWGSC